MQFRDSIEVATQYQGLANPIRVQILQALLSAEMCGIDIRDELGVRQSKISFHLTSLIESGWVVTRIDEHPFIFYRVPADKAELLEKLLCG